MMLTHVAGVAAAAVVLGWGAGLTWRARILVAVGFASVVPLLTYVFRVRQTRRLVNPAAALFLINVLYAARSSAMVTVVRCLLSARLRPAQSAR